MAQRQAALATAQQRTVARQQALAAAQAQVAALTAAPTPHQHPERPHSAVAQAQAKVETRQRQVDHQQQVVTVAQQRVTRQTELVTAARRDVDRLTQRLARFTADNAANCAPVHAVFRLDAGFGSGENLALLIELGYDVYTKPHHDGDVCRYDAIPASAWTVVGNNAEMVAWADQHVRTCPYPLDVALERFHTGTTLRHSRLVHFGRKPVTADLPAWFATYNDRQTIEAGIKEGKTVFQMHHLKVRAAPALWLQEQFAAFAANFVRWADQWVTAHCRQQPEHWATRVTASVKTQVQVAAHTPALVDWLADGCLLTFTDESLFAGRTIQAGSGAFQLSLPLYKPCGFDPFLPNCALIAQKLRYRLRSDV